ncbi:MAG: UvrD-helicase domain-containing protein [Microthrixaceae bacterium]
MTTLAVSRDLMVRFPRLDHAVRTRIADLTSKIQELTQQDLRNARGIHLEQYQNQRDPRARTVRLGDNHRGIVMVTDRADRLVLIDVLTHDEADRWMVNNEFRVNAATGAFEIFDAGALAELVDDVPAVPEAAQTVAAPLLFAHRSDREIIQLGVDELLLPLLRTLTDEDALQGLLVFLPPGQLDSLVMLLGHEPVETLYAELAGREAATQVDIDDVDAAVDSPASQGQFHVVDDQRELSEMLAKPLALWRTFLHPTQRKLAYKEVYNGPVRVTGGAGTGKTVVAMHRAKALVDRLQPGSDRSVLVTTFTRNLAQAIERDLRTLGGSDLTDRVDVLNIDRLARQVVQDAEGAPPGVAQGDGLEAIWTTAADEAGVEFPVQFLIQEWEQIILAQGIETRDEYLQASRAGRGVRLDRRARASVWKVVERATGELARRRQRTYLQIADDAAGYLRNESTPRYQHVIVDETQDLHETQLRLIRAAVPPGPNDLFLVGDAHQRIYNRRSALSKVGIDVRGRSSRLRINYRTTDEILRWSLVVLGELEFDDLDGGIERQGTAEYHSFLRGDSPEVVGSATVGDMARAAATRVQGWVQDGVDPSEIGLSASAQAALDTLEEALTEAGITSHRLGQDLKPGDGVALGTMHRMKGLEFRCVAVLGASDGVIPSDYLLARVAGDDEETARELQRQRCTLYVACTRAREHLWVGYAGRPSQFLPRGGSDA